MDTNANVQPVEQKGTKYTGVLVVLVVLVFLGLGLFYVVNLGTFGTGKPAPAATATPSAKTGATVTAQPELVTVDFTYKVKLVSADTIVLQGKNGDFTLPNDSAKVQAYAGLTKDSPKLELSRLKVGDSVNMEFVPGQSATLFVSQI